MYDFFFVPPVGTLSVSGPAELIELVVLLAVAWVTSQLASSLRHTQARAEQLAEESRAWVPAGVLTAGLAGDLMRWTQHLVLTILPGTEPVSWLATSTQGFREVFR